MYVKKRFANNYFKNHNLYIDQLYLQFHDKLTHHIIIRFKITLLNNSINMNELTSFY